MRRLLANKRFNLTTALALIIITSLTFQSSFRTDVSPAPAPARIPKQHNGCQIWPTAPQRSITYRSCQGEVGSPHLGDVGVLGYPGRCLTAALRFDHYSSSAPGRNWSEVRWGRVQERCATGGAEGLPFRLEDSLQSAWRRPPGPQDMTTDMFANKTGKIAIVLRTWDNYEYTAVRLTWLRTLIAEASLQRSGGYRVFLLVNVKDPEVRLEEDDEAYEAAMVEFVPEEFRDMALLFNERTLKSWFPLVEEHGAQDQMYQALQIFSHQFPEYDYVWQLEMDLRVTGHVHDMLESAASFSRTQGRRNLWERNGRFFNPALLNGSYEAFAASVDAEMGDSGVWGPVGAAGFEPRGPAPPPAAAFPDWGVGEEADLIGFMPMIDPVGTNWVYEPNIYNFATGASTPRRMAVVSMTRTSRRLLGLVSEAQRQAGMWLVSEATPETFALLHGLKAVVVPHPVTFANTMTPAALDAEIHRGPSYSKAGGADASILYTMQGYLPGPWWHASYWFTGGVAGDIWKDYLAGKRLLPPMLLHPVKDA
ncbi:hypothetical protein F4778DRAFT_720883 [Xylariomycetidae sp. FL2044]|nr:hypothetical protein F4778DRAFT_720883 [Xylariomycetidae sp. FL2044]